MRILSASLVIASLAIIGLSQNVSAHDFKPELVVQPPENTFAPLGFDDNDNSQVVLYGNLPNTCHKAGPTHYKVDKDRKTVFIRNEVYFYPGCWCAEVLVPYLQTVNLGMLPAGEYDIVVENSDGTFKKMSTIPVAVSRTASPDDYLYAPVEQLHFVSAQGGNPAEVELSGTFLNTCMSLKDILVNYRPNHVIEIQPIAAMEKTDCSNEPRPFKAKVKIKDSVHGRALLHVRSLNGQALNRVVDL